MMVMMTAITPSVNASRRPLVMRQVARSTVHAHVDERRTNRQDEERQRDLPPLEEQEQRRRNEKHADPGTGDARQRTTFHSVTQRAPERADHQPREKEASR